MRHHRAGKQAAEGGSGKALTVIRDLRESGVNQSEYLYRCSMDFIVWSQT